MQSQPASLSAREAGEVRRVNASGRLPVVLVHGLWLLPSSWQRWIDLFEAEGFVAVAPDWPGDPSTRTEALEHPDRFAGTTIAAVSGHVARFVEGLDRPPALIGHSFGGLIVQQLAGRGLASVTVAIDPAPFRGVLPLPISSLRAARPVLGNPANRKRSIMLTYEEFRFSFANAVDAAQAKDLYERFAVPCSGAPLFQAATANLNPRTEARVDCTNPQRGPLKILSGQRDNTVPWVLANAAFKRQRQNPGVTEIEEMPDRGHSLTIDAGWEHVAQAAHRVVRTHQPAVSG